MRHGYPATMSHGTSITILKRGTSGTTQTDNQVKHYVTHYNKKQYFSLNI